MYQTPPPRNFSVADCEVRQLGTCHVTSPMDVKSRFVDEAEKVTVFAKVSLLQHYTSRGQAIPGFQLAGPRKSIFFDPARVRAGIVTCGGLCPGQNDVIRSLVLTLKYTYAIERVVGFQYGYLGLSKRAPAPALALTPELVSRIHWEGGTILSSSRGAPTVAEMVDTLEREGIDILFTIGGDGTLRGALEITKELERRGRSTAVVGVPKTIDNDIEWIAQSFGFATAVEEGRKAIMAAHVEAKGAWNGIGIVKLMGRHSGFIAGHACLANSDANFCLIPEVPFRLDGKNGFLAALEARIRSKHHAVIVVAEGAGQDLLRSSQEPGRDASGNVKLRDIGSFLKDRVIEHFATQSLDATVKYIDPSYLVRSIHANAFDSEFCLMLGQHAVHAALAGRTGIVIGYWNHKFTHLPIELATRGRKQLEPNGSIWQSVLESTGQPCSML